MKPIVMGELTGLMRALALLLIASCTAPAVAAPVTIYPRWHWGGDGSLTSTCTAPVNVQCTAPRLVSKSGKAGSFDIMGRWSSAVRVRPAVDGGYLSDPLGYASSQGPFDGGFGSAWMAFVWLDQLPQHASSIMWWEGAGIASFALMVEPDGTVSLTYGQARAWRGRVRSTHKIGAHAWHHVAFVFQPGGNGTVRLLLNGVEEGSATLPLAGGPDQSPAARLAIGTFAGNTNYDLDGAVDEVKLIQFSPASEYLQAVRNEHGLHFRNRVLADLLASGRITPAQVDDFREPTFRSTSLLRAHVASFFTAANVCQPSPTCARPLDPLSVPQGGSRVGYVYPLFQQPTIYGTEGGGLQGRYNSLYLNLSEPCPGVGPGCGEAGRPRVTGYCDSAALTLWAVYKVFGYAARKYDYINDAEFNYTDSHSLTSVYIQDAPSAVGHYLLQDPTFNVSGRVAGSDYTLEQVSLLRAQPPVLDDGGYNFFGSGPDGPTWTWSSRYWDYFESTVVVLPAWQK